MAEKTPETDADQTPAAIAAPAIAGDAVRLGDEAAAPGAAPAKPLEKGGQGKALVRTRYPVDRFDHSVKGVEPIMISGTEVDRSKVGPLLKAAEEVGVELEEIENA